MSNDDERFSKGSPLTNFLKERWLSLLVGVVALIFILQNTKSVELKFLFWSIDWPLWIVLALLFLAGVIVGAVRTKRRLTRAD